MKTSKRQDLIASASRLAEIRTQVRELQRQEAAIKIDLKVAIGDSGALSLPGWLLTLTRRQRSAWDKAKLLKLLTDRVDEFRVESVYEILEVKKI